jgi:hypothetical protein
MIPTLCVAVPTGICCCDVCSGHEIKQGRKHLGQSLKNAVDWIAPWTLGGAKEWPYPEVTPFDHGKWFQIFRMASLNYGESL